MGYCIHMTKNKFFAAIENLQDSDSKAKRAVGNGIVLLMLLAVLGALGTYFYILFS